MSWTILLFSPLYQFVPATYHTTSFDARCCFSSLRGSIVPGEYANRYATFHGNS